MTDRERHLQTLENMRDLEQVRGYASRAETLTWALEELKEDDDVVAERAAGIRVAGEVDSETGQIRWAGAEDFTAHASRVQGVS